MLRAGKYFIGDPCYVVKEELWEEYCDKSFETPDGYFEIAGVKVFVSSTAYGDGLYTDTKYDYQFPVDAGIIGATPLDSRIIDNDKKIRAEKLGVILDIDHDFYCELVDDYGVITIDDIVIETE